MSETNFTEQDRHWLGAEIQRELGVFSKLAVQHAIAEIDSLRLENEGLKNSLFVAKMQTRTRSDEAWHRKTESLQAENDSLRAQLEEAKEDRREFAVRNRELRNERDTLRSENERIRSAVAWAYQMVGARWPNEQALDNLREALRLIQWGVTVGDGPHGVEIHLCPRCDQSEVRGHAPDCEVGAALAKKEQQEKEGEV